MIKKIDHIGIVVKDLEKSKQIYEKELHLEFVRQEQNPAFNVDIVFFAGWTGGGKCPPCRLLRDRDEQFPP